MYTNLTVSGIKSHEGHQTSPCVCISVVVVVFVWVGRGGGERAERMLTS